MRTLTTWLIGTAFTGIVVFALVYAIGSPSWYRSRVGRSLMLFPVSLGVLLGLFLLSQLIGPFSPWIWVTGLSMLNVAIWWRVVVTVAVQHSSRE